MPDVHLAARKIPMLQGSHFVMVVSAESANLYFERLDLCRTPDLVSHPNSIIPA